MTRTRNPLVRGHPFPSISLDPVKSSRTRLIELEENIEDVLAAFDHGPRDDWSWLACRKPLHRQLMSIFGILDDIPEENFGSYEVELNLFRGVVLEKRSTPASDSFLPSTPHSSWTREPLTVSESSNQTSIDCIDLRECFEDDEWLQSPAQVVAFLRSLLGADHEASPWGARGESLPLVVLLLPPNLPDVLLGFRVSDASPSWYLQGMAKLDSTQPFDGTDTSATCLIYRPLPPRDRLSAIHPETHEPATPVGCLWETRVLYEEGLPPETVYRTVAPPYCSHEQDYPHLLDTLLLPDNLQILEEDARAIGHWTAWPESQHYRSVGPTDEPPWTVFPLCHCFPANDVSHRQWIAPTCAHVPRTVALLQSLGDVLRTALFSRLEPGAMLEPHTGWSDLANHVLRLHIPLVVPPGGLCGTWVDGCVETHERGRPLLFDDSKTHRAFNYSDGERLVLILDLTRPPELPLGTATGGHTDELDKFIQQMGV